MAEFVDTENQKMQRAEDESVKSGFDAFGHPVSNFRKECAVSHCKAMGMKDMEKITGLVGRMSEAIRRDKPYEAMEAGMAYLDLTGTYRLLAVLCTAEEPK